MTTFSIAKPPSPPIVTTDPQDQPQPQPPPRPSPPEPTASIPLNSPLRTHPKRLLPASLSSTYPYGHISGHPRSAPQQAAFDARRLEILQSMSTREIERRYEECAERIKELLSECEERAQEVAHEIEKLKMEREMERRVWGKLRGMKEGGG